MGLSGSRKIIGQDKANEPLEVPARCLAPVWSASPHLCFEARERESGLARNANRLQQQKLRTSKRVLPSAYDNLVFLSG